MGSIVYVMVPIFVLSFGFSIMVIGRTMGSGRLGLVFPSWATAILAVLMDIEARISY